MKKLLSAFFGLSMLFLFSCEDPAEDVFSDVDNQKSNGSIDYDDGRVNRGGF